MGLPAPNGGCQCIQGYVWEGNGCLVDCSNKAYSTRQRNLTNSCQCIGGYFWVDNECRIDCGKVANSIGRSAGGCFCKQGFRWENNSCNVDCSNVANCNGRRLNSTSCSCFPGYTWWGNVCIQTSIQKRQQQNFRCPSGVFRCAQGKTQQNSRCPIGYTYNVTHGCSYTKTQVRVQANNKCQAGYYWVHPSGCQPYPKPFSQIKSRCPDKFDMVNG